MRLTGLADGDTLGLTGFGASAHLVLKLVRHRFPLSRVFVFARSPEERTFAREFGAVWAGDTAEQAPEPLRAIIDTTPAWMPIVSALGNLERGGRLVINAIRKEETDKEALLGLDYPRHLWMEKEIKSVANVTRSDVREFLQLAAEIPLSAEFQEYPLEQANRALMELKTQSSRGAKSCACRKPWRGREIASSLGTQQTRLEGRRVFENPAAHCRDYFVRRRSSNVITPPVRSVSAATAEPGSISGTTGVGGGPAPAKALPARPPVTTKAATPNPTRRNKVDFMAQSPMLDGGDRECLRHTDGLILGSRFGFALGVAYSPRRCGKIATSGSTVVDGAAPRHASGRGAGHGHTHRDE